MCDCAGGLGGRWFAEMDQKQSTACSDGQRRISRNSDRVRSATSQPQRRNDHAHFLPRRRADEDAEDDHTASHHFQSHLG